MNIVEQIIYKIKKNFTVEDVIIDDHSENHRGHSGSSDAPITHLIITVKSVDLMKMNHLERHRKVKKILEEEFAVIHSISLNII